MSARARAARPTALSSALCRPTSSANARSAPEAEKIPAAWQPPDFRKRSCREESARTISLSDSLGSLGTPGVSDPRPFVSPSPEVRPQRPHEARISWARARRPELPRARAGSSRRTLRNVDRRLRAIGAFGNPLCRAHVVERADHALAQEEADRERLVLAGRPHGEDPLALDLEEERLLADHPLLEAALDRNARETGIGHAA